MFKVGVRQYMKLILNEYFCSGLEDHEPKSWTLQIHSALKHCAALLRTNRRRKESQDENDLSTLTLIILHYSKNWNVSN